MQSINLNLVPGSFQQVFNCSQGDIGRQLTAKLLDGSTAYEIPAGSTVKIKATKPSGFGFDESATFSGSTVTITTAETMTNEWGRFPAELVITKDGNVIGTANFLFNIEKNPHPDSTVDGDAEEVIPELTLLVERVEAAASSVLDMEVVATTLPAGSQASYSYDEDLNKATFGIPQGEAGAGAAGVVASAYSSSKTYKVGDYVIHNSNLYRCITAITTAEAFTAAHWTQIVLADDVSDLKSDLQEAIDEFAVPTQEAVDNWLEAHPEATTTVEDGSLTEPKFAESLKLKAIKDYVTPEMFGAKGDGITDDTSAVQSAFNEGHTVLLTGKYKIVSPLQARNRLLVVGNCTKDVTTSNLIFATSVKACIVFSTSSSNITAEFDNVGFEGTNLENQGLFISSGSNKTTLTLENCMASSFDAVFVGHYSISRISKCTFYRIAKAFILGKCLKDTGFSYSTHIELYDAIRGQVDGDMVSGFWESSISDCYISGQGASYEHVGIFVGGEPIGLSISNCYIDYWTAYLIDVYTVSMINEPVLFQNCVLDSIITLGQTEITTGGWAYGGIWLLDSLIFRFNSSFNSNIRVPLFDFMYKGNQYATFYNIKIKGCHYRLSSTNADLEAYKFINTTQLCGFENCVFDFTFAKSNIDSIDEIVSLEYWSVQASRNNYFPILNYKVYDTMPNVAMSGKSNSFNGHIFVYGGNLYMNVNGTAYRINNA